ncbi:dCTP deaminase/dUTPase family protein [Qiania dongpingensis]|uniref:dUTP diphosphatase n=1 Tax=Qiania dongpingensis TaxID=2763669 RepID=A0A7G9G403_9FIRM|nr:deoxyuridine 5'-triphosphate nucleotidohydrolase [Qiania dongpingensis]QNM05535.1 deoxyuridine 5'-triphosphate nucleotidohydrolase [Qiania dongpingensis]
MKRIARFEKVSKSQFSRDFLDTFGREEKAACEAAYEMAEVPKRATSGSAGYDFITPVPICLKPGDSVKIPTGIRVSMEEGWVLQIYPRSGLGFKYRLQMNNTVGIVDSDYYHSENEGHIFIKITNDSREGKELRLEAGSGFAQGIFMEFGITEDDDAAAVRNGGFGSTGV